jgi:cell division protein FtsB
MNNNSAEILEQVARWREEDKAATLAAFQGEIECLDAIKDAFLKLKDRVNDLEQELAQLKQRRREYETYSRN